MYAMAGLWFDSALLPSGWARRVRITAGGGCIESVTTDTDAQPGDERHAIALPGLPNVHSHAFQRGLAGLTEPGELAGRVAAAAAHTGIGLTLLPVFYAHGGCGGAAPETRQQRFVSDPDGFARIVEACRRAVRLLAGASVGVAPHSLRAVTPG